MEATIDRTKLNGLIGSTNGLIFTVTFIKKDGSVRVMNCRKGVTYCLKGGVNKVVKESNSYVTAFDMVAKEYRTINLATVTTMKFKGVTYSVTGSC